MAEREVDHSTIARWVLHFSPILNDLIRHEMRRPSRSWRVDETYVGPRVINVDGHPAYATAITELNDYRLKAVESVTTGSQAGTVILKP